MNRELKNFYFTFGSAEHFPFKNTYIVIQAENYPQAIEWYRALYPDHTKGIINCSDVYTGELWESLNMARHYTEPALAETAPPSDLCNAMGQIKRLYAEAKETIKTYPPEEQKGLEEWLFSMVASAYGNKEDDIYRTLWEKYVRGDVQQYLEESDITLTDDQIDNIVEKYVWHGKYDCTLSYWDNLQSLIEAEQEAEKETEDDRDIL